MSEEEKRNPRGIYKFILIALVLAGLVVIGRHWWIGKNGGGDMDGEVESSISEAQTGFPSNILTSARGSSGGNIGLVFSQNVSGRHDIGPPPIIPHMIRREDWTSEHCLNCHLFGGYVPQFGAYSPITPHPQYLSCRQCHLTDSRRAEIETADFRYPSWKVSGRSALPGSPPWHSHDIKGHEDCLSCHYGPKAIVRIGNHHAARHDCQQCHVKQSTLKIFKSSLTSKL